MVAHAGRVPQQGRQCEMFFFKFVWQGGVLRKPGRWQVSEAHLSRGLKLASVHKTGDCHDCCKEPMVFIALRLKARVVV